MARIEMKEGNGKGVPYRFQFFKEKFKINKFVCLLHQERKQETYGYCFLSNSSSSTSSLISIELNRFGTEFVSEKSIKITASVCFVYIVATQLGKLIGSYILFLQEFSRKERNKPTTKRKNQRIPT